MQLAELAVYPVKSCTGLALESATVTPRGLDGDRRWVLMDGDGVFLTAREHPRLLLVTAENRRDGLKLRAPERTGLTVPVPADGATTTPVRVWKDHTTGADAGDEAAAWFSAWLGIDCRLIYQRQADRRSIANRPGGRRGDHVSFADGYPLLLIGTASLEDLNSRLDTPVAMTRFRPNLVVVTDTPFAEDDWRRIRIGETVFDCAKRCARCVLTTIDPATGIRHPRAEPMRTLRRYRFEAGAGGVLFGINLIPRSEGRLTLGEPAVVLDPA